MRGVVRLEFGTAGGRDGLEALKGCRDRPWQLINHTASRSPAPVIGVRRVCTPEVESTAKVGISSVDSWLVTGEEDKTFFFSVEASPIDIVCSLPVRSYDLPASEKGGREGKGREGRDHKGKVWAESRATWSWPNQNKRQVQAA